MAQTLVALKRWREAIALLHRAEEYFEQALKLKPASELESQLKLLKTDIEGQKFSVHANSVLSEDDQAETASKQYIKQKKVTYIISVTNKLI